MKSSAQKKARGQWPQAFRIATQIRRSVVERLVGVRKARRFFAGEAAAEFRSLSLRGFRNAIFQRLLQVICRRALGSCNRSFVANIVVRDGAEFREVARDRAVRVLDDLAEREERCISRRLFLSFENDLSQSRRCDVVLRLVVDDHHFFVRANHLRDIVESDVARLLRVVELSVLVALDDLRLRARLTRCCHMTHLLDATVQVVVVDQFAS